MSFFKFFVFIGFAFFYSCKQENKPVANEDPFKDPHSFSNPVENKIDHLDLDIAVDFEDQIIYGSATYSLQRTKGNELVMDTRDLTISKVLLDDKSETNFKLDPIIKSKEYMGQALHIQLKPETKKVKIEYSTSPKAAALQWLTPEQTVGKTWPFLFTQGQAILTRTWIPVQDGPGIRFTYSAKVKVPKDLMAVMSAENPTQKSTDGRYSFEMKQPIPAYLMALAVGDIQFAALGDRTGVYAEPQLLKKCEYEFSDVENILKAAEALYGPYRWGRYDLLVLPPSFPFGGMENPKLTFATPTIIAGDKSLISLVAHELAHSWSGNLVTNANWNNFWLNEGFTVYFERRIIEKLYGKDFADMETRLGYQDWMDEANQYGLQNPDTRLAVQLDNRDPDDGMTDIAYEKGYAFLRYLEKGTNRDSFDHFLRKYFDKFAFKTITTPVFLDYLKSEYLVKFPAFHADTDDWVYKPGIPKSCIKPESVKFDAIDTWIAGYESGKHAEKDLPKGLSAHEWVYLIRNLPDSMTQSQFNNWNNLYRWSKSGNNEIKAAWIEKSTIAGYGKDIIKDTAEFLNAVGRRKYLEPIYTALIKHGLKSEAREIYQKARRSYHYVSVRTIDELLNVKTTES